MGFRLGLRASFVATASRARIQEPAAKPPKRTGSASLRTTCRIVIRPIALSSSTRRGPAVSRSTSSIYDRQYSPFLFNQANQRYVPAESVYAALEVKQDLSREHILYAGDKAASVRRLHRTSAPVPHVEGVAKPRSLPPIVAGILTYQSSWTPPFGDPLRQAVAELTAEKQLNIGCALVHGTFEVRHPEDGRPDLTIVEGPRSLLQLLMRLLKQLQSLATAPAIDYEAYLLRFQGDGGGGGRCAP
jgi:hypothetical protein